MHVISNGVRIHVEKRGSGAPSLVFLHYWGGSSRTWRHVTERLAGRYQTIATDHRGWGQSDAPPEGYALADLAGDAERVIEALDPAPYVLVGHSMGGKVAQLMASRASKGLVGLVLVAPAPPTPLALPAEARAMMAAAYETRASVEATIDQVLTAKALDPEDRAQVIEDSLHGGRQAKAAWPAASSLEDISGEVHGITVPTLVIAGALDRVDHVETLRAELLTRIPQATLHVLPGTGHLSPLEEPQAIAGLIADFVATLELPASTPSAGGGVA